MSAHQTTVQQTDDDRAEPIGLTFWGTLGMVLAVIATACLALVPWLAYLPAVVAAGLFTMVMWTGVLDTFVRGHLAVRLVAVIAAAVVSTALFWSAAPGWYVLPLLWSVLAAISTRAKTWIVTAALAALYASGLVWLLVW